MDQKKVVESEHNTEDTNICEKCMEELPHIATTMFAYLDNKSLCQSRQVSKSWLNFIDSQKVYWKRVTHNQPGWDLTIPKIDSEATKILGKCFLRLAKNKGIKCPPIFCAIDLDNDTLLKMLIEKLPSSISSTLRSKLPYRGKNVFLLPVGYAALYKHMKCLTYIIVNFESKYACGYKSHAADSANITPLHLAALSRNCKAVEILMSLEKVYSWDKHYRITTPLDFYCFHS